jgi:hypothetical protein
MQVSLRPDKNNGTLREDQHTFLIISRSVLLRIRNISEKVVKKFKTHILGSLTFFLKNLLFYEMMWKNIVERDRPQMTRWRMRIACRIPKAANTHTGCITLIAFPLQ